MAGSRSSGRADRAERKALYKFCAKALLIGLSVVTFALAIVLLTSGVRGRSETSSLRFANAGGKGSLFLDPFATLSAPMNFDFTSTRLISIFC